MTLKTCALREGVDTIVLDLDRRKIAKCSLSSNIVLLDGLVFVSQIRCGARPVTSDGFIPAFNKCTIPSTCQHAAVLTRAVRLGSLVDLRAISCLRRTVWQPFHFLLSYARRKKTFLFCILQEVTSNIAFSVFTNQFCCWTVLPPGFFQLSVTKTKHSI